MGAYVVQRVVKLMNQRRIAVMDAKILVLGLTFKENCPDLRNTRVVDIVQEFGDYHACVDVYDPWVDPQEARHEYGIDPVAELKSGHYDAIILAVGHRQFREMGAEGIRAVGQTQRGVVRCQISAARRQPTVACKDRCGVRHENSGHGQRRLHRLDAVSTAAGAR
jgi:UDP-N-acetyl-D-mannosaminuronate dehydrogenase